MYIDRHERMKIYVHGPGKVLEPKMSKKSALSICFRKSTSTPPPYRPQQQQFKDCQEQGRIGWDPMGFCYECPLATQGTRDDAASTMYMRMYMIFDRVISALQQRREVPKLYETMNFMACQAWHADGARLPDLSSAACQALSGTSSFPQPAVVTSG